MSLKKNHFLAVLRLIAMIVWLVLMPLVFLVAKFLRIPNHTQLPHTFHQGVCIILGIKRQFSGQMHTQRPTLYVSNHVSYIDIFVLGSLPAYFIAKSEVANWPILGPLSKFQNTLFIERSAGKARDHLVLLKEHLSKNNSLTLFPEGTSTNGMEVKPFKSSLFEAANLSNYRDNNAQNSISNVDDSMRVAIQAITVAYTHYNGDKITEQSVRDNYAWYAKMPFASHFINLFSLKKVGVKIHFHPVCYLDEFDSRKQCADHCQSLVAAKLSEFVN